MRQYGEFRRFLYKEFSPITKGLLLGVGVISLLSKLNALIGGFFSLQPVLLFIRPWTIITYPLVNQVSLSLLFAVLWFWFIGGSLERGWGSQSYTIFLLLVTLVTGAAISLVSVVFFSGGIGVNGLWLPLVGLTWAWAEVHPDWEVLFWGIFPIKAKLVAWISAGSTFFTYFSGAGGIGGLFLGLASISGILVVYLFSSGGPFSRGIRYWAWQRGFSYEGWKDKMKERFRKRRLRRIK